MTKTVCSTCGHGASSRTLRAITNKPKKTTKPPTPEKKAVKIKRLAALAVERYNKGD